jgi:hypothetical protein
MTTSKKLTAGAANYDGANGRIGEGNLEGRTESGTPYGSTFVDAKYLSTEHKYCQLIVVSLQSRNRNDLHHQQPLIIR